MDRPSAQGAGPERQRTWSGGTSLSPTAHDRQGHRLAQGVGAAPGGSPSGPRSHRREVAPAIRAAFRKRLRHLIGVVGGKVRTAHQQVIAEPEQRVQIRGPERSERRARRAVPRRRRTTAERPRADRWSRSARRQDLARASPGARLSGRWVAEQSATFWPSG